MSVSDFIEKKGNIKKYAQVSLEEEFFEEIQKALKEDKLTFQSVLTAGLKSWLHERKKKNRGK